MNEKINFEKLSKTGTGWDGKIDKKDWSYSDIFGATSKIVPKDLGREKLLRESPLAWRENLVYQLYHLSCVQLHITMKNMWNSFVNDKSTVKLSWPMLFALVKFIVNKGTSVNETLKIANNMGQCLDKTFSQDLVFAKPNNWIHNPKLITEEMKKEAENWKIGNYSRIYDTSLNNIYEALQHEPILIGVCLNSNWDNKVIYSPSKAMNHLTLALEPTDEGHIKIWEGFKKDELDIRILHKDSFIGAAYSFRDIPDKIKFNLQLKNKYMLRPIKGDEKPEVYFEDKIGRKHWVRRNMQDLYDFAGIKGEDIEIKPQEVVDKMPEGAPFDMKILQFWNFAKLYLRRDILNDEEKNEMGKIIAEIAKDIDVKD